MPLNLNSDNPIVIVKPDQQTITYTGATTHLINVGGGVEIYAGLAGSASKIRTLVAGHEMTITQSGDTITFDAGVTGGTFQIIGSGNTSVSNPSGNTWIVYTPSGITSVPWGSITGTLSGQTDLWNELQDRVDFTTYNYNNNILNQELIDINNGLSWLSGNTIQTCDDITGCTDTLYLHTNALDNYWDSGQTTSYVQSQISGFTTGYTFTPSGGTLISQIGNNIIIYSPTGGTSSWNDLTDKPSWLSGTTLNEFQTGHTHSQYALQTSINYYTGTTAPNEFANKTVFNNYTGATQTMYNDSSEITGFLDNANINVSYNSTNRTITLTNASGIYYYWRGKKHSLGTSWTSSGHTNNTSGWYLYSADGLNFAWSTQSWSFNQLMVAYRPANTTIAIREVHGLMQNESHEELHRTLGAYRLSGFGLTNGTYALQPVTPNDADNTFGLESGVVADEDLQSSLPAWTQGSYTLLYFTGTGATRNFVTGNTLPFRMGTTYPLINSWNGTTFSETETASGRYFNYYIIRVPVTSDAGSQLYRAIVLQPQYSYTSLASAQAETTQSLNFGDFSSLSPETVLVERITYRAQSTYNSATGRVRIESISILTGTKFSQVSTVTGVGTQTAGNISVTPVSPFVSTNMQDLSDEYATAFANRLSIYQLRRTVNANYNAVQADNNYVLIWSDNSDYSITLPSTGLTIGSKFLFFKASGTGTLTVSAGAGSTIYGNAPSINSGDYLEFYYQAAGAWYVIRKNKPVWDKIQSKPAWLSGTTLSAFEAQHAHSSLYQTKANTITGATSMSGTSIIHGTSVASNKIQLKGLFSTGSVKLISSTNGITISGGSASDSSKMDLLANISQKTGTTYTILSTDSGKVLEFTNTGATTITLPTGLTTGFQCSIVNYGNGTSSATKTIAAGTGATVKSALSALKLSTIFGAATAYYRGSNIWVVFGDLSA